MHPEALKLANWINNNVNLFVESAYRSNAKAGVVQLATAAMLHKMAYDLTSAAIKLGNSSDIEIAKNLPTVH